MDAPLIKHELVIQRCPNPEAIAVTIGTAQSLNWVKKLNCYFDCLWGKTELPMTQTLVVYRCYDFEEIFAYLASKPFCFIGPPIVMKNFGSSDEKLPVNS